eukprot:2128513-Amphidinium_carterae.1
MTTLTFQVDPQRGRLGTPGMWRRRDETLDQRRQGRWGRRDRRGRQSTPDYAGWTPGSSTHGTPGTPRTPRTVTCLLYTSPSPRDRG